MATFELDGKEYEYTVLDGTASTYGAAASAVDLYTEKYSGFTVGQTVLVKWATTGAATVVGGIVNIIQDEDKVRAVFKTAGGSYVGGVASATASEAVIALAAGLGTTVSVPVVIGVGIVAGVVFSIAGTEATASLYNMVKSWFGYGTAQEEGTTIDIGQNGTIIKTTNITQDLYELNAILANESKVELFGETTLREYLKIDKSTNTATVSANTQEAKATIIQDILATKTSYVDKMIHSGQTYDIKNLTNTELKNAVENIDDISFLLSNITVFPGEIIYSGEELLLDDMEINLYDNIGVGKPLYQVIEGDTISSIAEGYNISIKELVTHNLWLFDKNRIHFQSGEKVLIEENTSISNSNNQVYTFENNNTLQIIESDEGNDTFNIGQNHAFIFDSGGNNTYNLEDNYSTIIVNNDQHGVINFGGNTLSEAYSTVVFNNLCQHRIIPKIVS